MSDLACDQIWYCLPSLEADAATQMALDVELVDRCEGSASTAYVRFYRMSPPAVTIGRNQGWTRVIDPGACADRGWKWVRRPTGGGALLHEHEINYAVAAGRDLFARAGVAGFRAIFVRIVMALAAGLEGLGLSPSFPGERPAGADEKSREQHGLCGRSLTREELALNGRKLVAAAQLLRPDAILQHGTVYQRAPDLCDRFWPLHPSALSPHLPDQRWTDLGPGLRMIDWRDTANRLREGFVQALNVHCRSWEPGRREWDSIRRRVAAWERSGWHHRR